MRYLAPLSVTLPLLFVATATSQENTRPADRTANTTPAITRDYVSRIPWRQLGPANMVGRITDIEVVGEHNNTWYVASASGGLFKTTNAGTTWTRLFRNQHRRGRWRT